jgi:coiled-coil domain-containing protein 41
MNGDINFFLFQLWTPQRMEMVRLQLREEVEKVYRERLAAAESDTEAHRLACSQLKYDFTFLKSEYEHETQLHRQVVDELKQKYEAEVCILSQISLYKIAYLCVCIHCVACTVH